MNGEDITSIKLCGCMKIEDSSHKFTEHRYFELDLDEHRLNIYYEHPRDLPKTNNGPYYEIDLNVISKVSAARKLKPKCGYCFYITHSGEQFFIQANDEQEMIRWIDALNAACRIIVTDGSSTTLSLAPPNSKTEVAGGFIIQTKQENTDSGAESLEHYMPALSLDSYKSGYATKQGAVRKNWKKRYFVLDANGLSYYKHDQEKDPIKTIPLSDIRHARVVDGEHHPHRQHLFEVITEDRTFNIQCESRTDCEGWITQINQFKGGEFNPNNPSLSSNNNNNYPAIPPETTQPSRVVWECDTLLHPDDKQSKLNLRRSKKSWQLW